MRIIETNSVSETEEAGRALAERIAESDRLYFIEMYGDLGAGKTAFVRGLASVLSPGSRVKSPTYTIVNEYRRGAVPLFHFDLYRVENAIELGGFGFEEYVESGNCVAEWSEHLGDAHPQGAVRVTIEKTGEESRRIIVENIEF